MADKEKAKRYAIINYWFVLINFAYTLLFMVVFMWSGASQALADWALGVSGAGADALYLLSFIILTTAALVPISFYQGFVLEHRFELSNQTAVGWLADQLKTLALTAIIFVPAGLVGYWLLARAGGLWWVYGAAGWIGFTFVLAYVAPVVIMPLFNKFEPIEATELKAAILKLAERAEVGVSDVLRTDMSKRTKKANAFFAGAGNTRRIVLGDTLLDHYEHDEVLTVVGHEMGHWKLRHLVKNTLAGAVLTVAAFGAADRLLNLSLKTFALSGVADIAGLPLIIIAFMALAFVATPAMNALSRRFELEADRFELELVRKPGATITAFEKMAEQNLADPDPHPLIEALLYSHPSIGRRVALARDFRDRTGGD